MGSVRNSSSLSSRRKQCLGLLSGSLRDVATVEPGCSTEKPRASLSGVRMHSCSWPQTTCAACRTAGHMLRDVMRAALTACAYLYGRRRVSQC